MRRAQDRARSATIKSRALGALKLASDENVPAKRADFFLLASYQILKNDVILINYGSFFQEKESIFGNKFFNG